MFQQRSSFQDKNGREVQPVIARTAQQMDTICGRLTERLTACERSVAGQQIQVMASRLEDEQSLSRIIEIALVQYPWEVAHITQLTLQHDLSQLGSCLLVLYQLVAETATPLKKRYRQLTELNHPYPVYCLFALQEAGNLLPDELESIGGSPELIFGRLALFGCGIGIPAKDGTHMIDDDTLYAVPPGTRYQHTCATPTL